MSDFRAGNLRHRVTLVGPVRVSDGGGGATVTWLAVADLWAAIRPIKGKEILYAESLSGQVTHEFTLRWRDGVVPAMRFHWSDRIFEILAVFDADERRRQLTCHCREELL
ncbi:MAG: phage head closure protein [Proteobacteria bacterium]|nr:phage head closure protein [Pseudomonadota bacterium]